MTANTPQKPTTPREWKKGTSEPLELPSGNRIRVRRMDMGTLMATGKMPNFLINMVKKAVERGTGVVEVEAEMADLMGNSKALQDMATFLDDLIVMLSIEPKVHVVPEDDQDRDEDLLYTDDIDQEDKSYIFGIVSGGAAEMAKFRGAATADVAIVPGLADVVMQAERTSEVG